MTGEGPARTRREENEIGEGGRNPCVAPSEAYYGAEEWVARSLINTAARFLLRSSLVLFFYYSTFTFNLSLAPLSLSSSFFLLKLQ
jgi:hypothetical protein